jgi:hypothetical protein
MARVLTVLRSDTVKAPRLPRSLARTKRLTNIATSESSYTQPEVVHSLGPSIALAFLVGNRGLRKRDAHADVAGRQAARFVNEAFGRVPSGATNPQAYGVVCTRGKPWGSLSGY